MEFEEDMITCLECQKEEIRTSDLELCEECKPKFDLELLWKKYDENQLDVLDFNESKTFREQFRKIAKND